MRVISGKFGSRNFDAPSGRRTHPMSDRVRGAIFNALGDISGLTVLDAFAGSGALGFEAISRGALNVVAIDSDKNAKKILDNNIEALGLGRQIKAIQANVSAWSDYNSNARFDIIVCDPPYDHLQLQLINKLTRHLKPTGVLVLSWPGKEQAPALETLKTAAQKNYGDAQLVFYRKSS